VAAAEAPEVVVVDAAAAEVVVAVPLLPEQAAMSPPRLMVPPRARARRRLTRSLLASMSLFTPLYLHCVGCCLNGGRATWCGTGYPL
jgi:hypothetical protein